MDHQLLFRHITRHHLPDYIRNTSARPILFGDSAPCAALISGSRDDEAYITSPYAKYILSLWNEFGEGVFRLLDDLPNLRRIFYGILSDQDRSIDVGLFDCIYLNNWLLGTNPHLRNFSATVPGYVKTLKANFPGRPILIRNLLTTEELEYCIAAPDFLLIPSRVVLVWKPDNISRNARRNITRDIRLSLESGYVMRLLEPDAIDNCIAERLAKLYTDLYLSKYDSYNVGYTSKWFLEGHATRSWKTFVIEHTENERIDGMATFLESEQGICPQVAGYDLQVPQSVGLYRMLWAAFFSMAMEQHTELFMSSGVSHFKSVRGGNRVIEYDAVYLGSADSSQVRMWKEVQQLMVRRIKKLTNSCDVSANYSELLDCEQSLQAQGAPQKTDKPQSCEQVKF